VPGGRQQLEPLRQPAGCHLEPGDQVPLPFEPGVREVDAVERQNRADHRVPDPAQQGLDREIVAPGDERLAGGPGAEHPGVQGSFHHGRYELVRVSVGPRPPGRHQLIAEQRARALERGQAHVLDRVGVSMLDHLVEETLDGTGEEVAHRDVELSEAVVLAPFLIVLVVVPQRRQVPAERVDGTGAIGVSGRAEPVAVQLQIGELVGQARPDGAGHGQRRELRVSPVCPGGRCGLRHPPRGVDVRLASIAAGARHGSILPGTGVRPGGRMSPQSRRERCR